jgi:hypothetical protein
LSVRQREEKKSMGARYDWERKRWVPIPRTDAADNAPLPRAPRRSANNSNKRQVPRVTLLRGLAEEIAYEESLAKLYAGLLASVIVEGDPTLKAEYRRMLTLLAA